MITMRIEAVLFDFGNTLVQTPLLFNDEACLFRLHQSLSKNGVSISYEEYKKAHIDFHHRLFARYSLREVPHGFRIAEVLNRFGYSVKPTDKIIAEAIEAFVQPWVEARTIEKHIPSILRTLKKRYKLGVISNFGHSLPVKKTLEKFGLVELFDAVVVSADVGWRKPSPKIFKKALRALKVSASKTVFVGDEPHHDIQGAKKFGMRTILLKKSSAKGTRYEVKPDQTIYELKELPNALKSIEAKNLNK